MQVCVICRFDLFYPTNLCKTDSDQTWSTPNKPSHPLGGESNFGDSSGPLFSIYSKAAEDEDNKLVERWQKDADGILFFVSLRVGHSSIFAYKLEYYRLVYSLPQSLHSLL
jgi:hypothetical protein